MKPNMALTIETRLKLLAVSIVLIASSGCATPVILHPIEKADIVAMQKGVAYAPEKDGWFLSDYYFKKVVDAKVQK